MAEQNKATVATMSPRFAALEQKRKLCRTLMGGTEAMKAAKTTYLPQHPAEKIPAYKVRLEMCILTNFLERAVNKGANKIFNTPITLKDNVPDEIKTICENIDRKGKSLDSFMLGRGRQAFVDGISFALVDSPRVDKATTEAGDLSVAEADKYNIRPYVIPVDAQDLLEVLTEMIEGVLTITRVRVYEVVDETDGDWGTKQVPQVRVLRLQRTQNEKGGWDSTVSFEIYRQNAKAQWIRYKNGATQLSSIMLIAFYTNQVGFMEGEPVFQSVAELNLDHWRSKSEQRTALTYDRFAQLTATGVAQEDQIEVGPTKLLRSTNKDAKFGKVESNGTGLEHGWKDLESIKNDIEHADAALRIDNAGKVTATAAALESADSNAGLIAVSLGFKNSIEKMFDYFAEIMGINEGEKKNRGGEVEISTSLNVIKGTDTGLVELGKRNDSGKLSNTQYFKEMIRRGELPEDFDIEANEAEISNQGQTAPSPEEVAAAAALKEARAKEKKPASAVES